MGREFMADPEELKVLSAKFGDAAEEIETVITMMDNLMSDLSNMWSGDAKDAAEDKYFNELQGEFRKAQDLASELQRQIADTAAYYEESDQNVRNAWS